MGGSVVAAYGIVSSNVNVINGDGGVSLLMERGIFSWFEKMDYSFFSFDIS